MSLSTEPAERAANGPETRGTVKVAPGEWPHLPAVTQGAELVDVNGEYRLYIPTGPDVSPVDGALLDAELARAGLELTPGWEDDWSLVARQGTLASEVGVRNRADASAAVA